MRSGTTESEPIIDETVALLRAWRADGIPREAAVQAMADAQDLERDLGVIDDPRIDAKYRLIAAALDELFPVG